MAYSLVAHTLAQGNSSGATSSGIDTTGASLIVLTVASYVQATQPTISDSKGNTWTALTAWGNNGGTDAVRVRLYYCHAPTVGSGHTFTASGANSFAAVGAQAWSGAAPSPFDQQNGQGTLAAPPRSTGSVTPTQAGELLVTGLGCGVAGEPSGLSINGGFTSLGSLPNSSGASFGIAHGYLVQSSAAAANPAWSWTGTPTSNSNGAGIATFKAGSIVPIVMHLNRQRRR